MVTQPQQQPQKQPQLNNSSSDSNFITILHFNDCYNIEPNKASSGAAGFLTAINQFRHLNPIILFSGDIISPSFMSTFTKGEQMIPVLNDIGVHCAVFGNHEFDYGVDNLIDFTKRTNFPWLLSNAIDKETSNQLGDGLIYHIIHQNKLKFGLIGLIEQEWLSTLSTLEMDDVIYQDFVTRGKELAIWLKQEHKVDYVIALTHFRTLNDIKLSDMVPEIDLILGGHDHEYEIVKRPNSYIIKSGTDFREFSKIKLQINKEYIDLKETKQNNQHTSSLSSPLLFNKNVDMSESIVKNDNTVNNVERKINKTCVVDKDADSDKSYINDKITIEDDNVDVNVNVNVNVNVDNESLLTKESRLEIYSDDSSKQKKLVPFLDLEIERIECSGYEEDAELKKKLEKFVTSIDSKMGQVLGQFNCDLDGRFSSIRRKETNLGNFVTDIMLASTHADLAILNSGTLRSDRIHPKGDFTMRDLFNILGYIDPIAVLKASGWHIWQALENGVSAWPKFEGRFPQISGCSFAFDPKKPPMNRIDPKDIIIGDEPINLKKDYKLTTKAYLASGKDGYDMLKECEILVPGDESPDLTTSILNHFESIKILKSNRRTHHRQSVICLSRSTLKKLIEVSGSQDGSESLLQAPASPKLDLTSQQQQQQQQDIQTSNIHHQADPLLYLEVNHQSNNNNNSNRNKSVINNNNNNFESSTDNKTTIIDTNTILDAEASVALSPSTIGRLPRLKRIMSLSDFELEMCKLEPKVEGRIVVIN